MEEFKIYKKGSSYIIDFKEYSNLCKINKKDALNELNLFAKYQKNNVEIINIEGNIFLHSGFQDNLLDSEWKFNCEIMFFGNTTSNFENKYLRIKNINCLQFTIVDLKYFLYLLGLSAKNKIHYSGVLPNKLNLDKIGLDLRNCDTDFIDLNFIKGTENLNNILINIWYKTFSIVNKIKIFDVKNIGYFRIGGELNIGNLVIENLLTNSDYSSIFLIDSKKIENFELNNLINLSHNFQINNIEIGNLIIRNSDLGKMKFNGVNIGKLTLENVTLNDCIFNGTTFDSYELGNEIGEEKIALEKLKDNYRQLKFVMDKNGNHIEANKFFEMEMELYEKIIDSKKIFSKGWFKKLHTEGFSSINAGLIGEKLALIIGSIISNHGNNIVKPIFLIVMLAFFATDIKFLYDSFPIFTKALQEFTFYKNINSSELIVLGTRLFFILIFYLIVYYFLKKFVYTSIFFFFLIIQFGLGYQIIDSFIGFLLPFNPFYGLDFSTFKELNSIEKTALGIYKITYGIILWHLIVAAKRTTKR